MYACGGKYKYFDIPKDAYYFTEFHVLTSPVSFIYMIRNFRNYQLFFLYINTTLRPVLK